MGIRQDDYTIALLDQAVGRHQVQAGGLFLLDSRLLKCNASFHIVRAAYLIQLTSRSIRGIITQRLGYFNAAKDNN